MAPRRGEVWSQKCVQGIEILPLVARDLTIAAKEECVISLAVSVMHACLVITIHTHLCGAQVFLHPILFLFESISYKIMVMNPVVGPSPLPRTTPFETPSHRTSLGFGPLRSLHGFGLASVRVPRPPCPAPSVSGTLRVALLLLFSPPSSPGPHGSLEVHRRAPHTHIKTAPKEPQGSGLGGAKGSTNLGQEGAGCSRGVAMGGAGREVRTLLCQRFTGLKRCWPEAVLA